MASPPDSPRSAYSIPIFFALEERDGALETAENPRNSSYKDKPVPPIPQKPHQRHSSFVHHSALPPPAITLFIDQEGFRSISPRLYLAQHSPTSFVYHPSHDCLPAPFHASSVFQKTPTLRRLALDHLPERDFLPRFASLSLSQNGVFAIDSTDPKRPHIPHWSFVYSVHDRLSNAGRPMPGEKVLVIHSFECSPDLFSPSHAQKYTIVKVLRKGLSSKIASHPLNAFPHDIPPLASPISQSRYSRALPSVPPLPLNESSHHHPHHRSPPGSPETSSQASYTDHNRQFRAHPISHAGNISAASPLFATPYSNPEHNASSQALLLPKSYHYHSNSRDEDTSSSAGACDESSYSSDISASGTVSPVTPNTPLSQGSSALSVNSSISNRPHTATVAYSRTSSLGDGSSLARAKAKAERTRLLHQKQHEA